MNKYNYHWKDSVRLRMGMHWKGESPSRHDYPSLSQCILLLLLVFILWAWVMDRDFAEQAAAEIERKERIAEKRANELGDCIEGRARFVTSDGYAIVCRKAEQFKI